VRTVVGALVLVAALAACGDGGDGSGACGPVRREPLDSRSVHVLPGADEPEYRTDPPTSGPHLPAPSTSDVRDEPIAGPVQVGLLEEGKVLIQHVGLTAAERADVEALAGDGVIVAPADSLPDDAAVVATAWVTKQVCTAVDLTALEAFASDRVDKGPGQHG
jgi:hypothetical protein